MLLCNALLSAHGADVAPFVAAAPSEPVSCLNQRAVYRCSRTNTEAEFEVGSAEEEKKLSLADVEGTISLRTVRML